MKDKTVDQLVTQLWNHRLGEKTYQHPMTKASTIVV